MWKNRDSPMRQTLQQTASFLKNISGDVFEQISPKLSLIMSNARDSSGNLIFKDQTNALRFLQDLHTGNKYALDSDDLSKTVNDDNDGLERVVQYEDIVMQEISPLMRRRILSSVTPTHVYAE